MIFGLMDLAPISVKSPCLNECEVNPSPSTFFIQVFTRFMSEISCSLVFGSFHDAMIQWSSFWLRSKYFLISLIAWLLKQRIRSFFVLYVMIIVSPVSIISQICLYLIWLSSLMRAPEQQSRQNICKRRFRLNSYNDSSPFV